MKVLTTITEQSDGGRFGASRVFPQHITQAPVYTGTTCIYQFGSSPSSSGEAVAVTYPRMTTAEENT